MFVNVEQGLLANTVQQTLTIVNLLRATTTPLVLIKSMTFSAIAYPVTMEECAQTIQTTVSQTLAETATAPTRKTTSSAHVLMVSQEKDAK